jgi:hypothetical protein
MNGVFCEFAPTLYNEDYRPARNRIELRFGVGSCSRELSRISELAIAAENWESRQSKVIENNGKKGKTSCVIWSYSETVMNPLPGND